jgi:hypothetical protein
MLPGMVSQSPISQDYGLSRARDWKLSICLWPRRCFLSDKPLWLKRAYVGVRMITGPGTPVYETYYIDRTEFLLWNLKGKK